MKYYRMRDLLKLLPVSRHTILRMIKSGDFPQPVKLAKRAVGFNASEVDAWLQNRQERQQ